MKIKIEETKQIEVEVEFPSYTKWGNCYYYNPKEGQCLAIYFPDSLNYYTLVNTGLQHPKCSREEVEKAFSQTVQKMQGVFNLIDTTEMNLPVTETLTNKEFENELHKQGGLHGN